MKKFSVLIAVLVAGLLASVVFFAPCRHLVMVSVQKILSAQESHSVVLVPIDDSALQKLGLPTLNAKNTSDILLLIRELGAQSFVFDLNQKNPVVKIDSLVQKEEISSEKQASLFNIKIVIPGKEHVFSDTKTPELSHTLFPAHSFPLTSFSDDAFLAGNVKTHAGCRNLIYRKNNAYYADCTFASVLAFLDAQKITISDREIEIAGKNQKNRTIPREKDGSILLKYPASVWNGYNSLPFTDLLSLSTAEKNFFDYISLMDKKGFFGEFDGENPIELYKTALLAQNNLLEYRALKKKFYSAMSVFLSGKQERVLTESVSDEESKKTIANMFITCRRLFSEIETARAKISEKCADSLCIFALTADSRADFTKSPYDTKFPKSVESFVLANMILSDDFFSPSTLIIAFSLSFLCLFVVILLFLLLMLHIRARSQNLIKAENSFSQGVSSVFLKKIRSHHTNLTVDAQKSESSVLAVSISGVQMIENLLNESQFVAFLNYYLEKISAVITQYGGIVESYRNDEVISLFGNPIFDEAHCVTSALCALAIKDIDREINADIHVYPKSPKIDGMNDDLYTAFYILNHNERKISTRIGIYSSEVTAACIGSKDKKSFRITDDSWKKAVYIKDFSKKLGVSGVLVNEMTAEELKEAAVLRKIGKILENSEESLVIYEILGSKKDDDEKLWNYTLYWNQAIELKENGEKEKALAIFQKLSAARPSDKLAKYFIKSINSLE